MLSYVPCVAKYTLWSSTAVAIVAAVLRLTRSMVTDTSSMVAKSVSAPARIFSSKSPRKPEATFRRFSSVLVEAAATHNQQKRTMATAQCTGCMK